jgi:hypothetical protein
MDISDRLKTYTAFADISRRWTAVMDAKAAFISTLNGALLAFLSAGIKVFEQSGLVKGFGVITAILALIALVCAVIVILPRGSVSMLTGRKVRWTPKYRPVSFYGHVADQYGPNNFKQLEEDAAFMDSADFAQEALEQHFAISIVIRKKERLVSQATMVTISAVIFGGFTLVARMVC